MVHENPEPVEELIQDWILLFLLWAPWRPAVAEAQQETSGICKHGHWDEFDKVSYLQRQGQG